MHIIIYEEEEKWVNLVKPPIIDIYEISTYGRIRNRFTGRYISQCKNEKGYYMVSLTMDKTFHRDHKTFKVHKLVMETFIDYPLFVQVGSSDRLTSNHLTGEKSDNSIYNLEYASHSENVLHSYSEGLNIPRRGKLNGMSIYDECIIRRMCELIRDGKGTKYIRKIILDEYDVEINRYLVFDLKHKKGWTHVTDEYF